MIVSLRFFGVLKKIGPFIIVQCPYKITVREFRILVVNMLYKTTSQSLINIIKASAIGTSDKILNEDELIVSTKLVLLPPVCGG